MKSLALALGLCAAAIPCAAAQAPGAQETAAAAAPDARARWEAMSPQERREIRERFRAFQRLSDADRARLALRHRALEETRADALAQVPAERRAAIDRLPSRERRRRVDRLAEEWLDAHRNALFREVEGAGAGKRRLRDAMSRYAAERLVRLEDAGVLDAGEAEELLQLPPRELRERLHRILRRDALRRPSAAFIALPAAERERIAALPPAEFRRALRRIEGKGERPAVPRRVRELFGAER